jgi:hypothetical protein
MATTMDGERTLDLERRAATARRSSRNGEGIDNAAPLQSGALGRVRSGAGSPLPPRSGTTGAAGSRDRRDDSPSMASGVVRCMPPPLHGRGAARLACGGPRQRHSRAQAVARGASSKLYSEIKCMFWVSGRFRRNVGNVSC